MRMAVLVISAVITSMVALGTVYQAYLWLWRPELTAIPNVEFQSWSRWRRAVFYCSMVAAFIGVMFMIYKGVEGALWFIPKSWRRITDDGESEWVGYGIALFLAFFGAGTLFAKLHELAEVKAKQYWAKPRSER